MDIVEHVPKTSADTTWKRQLQACSTVGAKTGSPCPDCVNYLTYWLNGKVAGSLSLDAAQRNRPRPVVHRAPM